MQNSHFCYIGHYCKGKKEGNVLSKWQVTGILTYLDEGRSLFDEHAAVGLGWWVRPPHVVQVPPLHRLQHNIARLASKLGEREREMFYLTTHSTHFIYGYMASDTWLRTILIVRKETRCRHIGYSNSKGSFICTILQTG